MNDTAELYLDLMKRVLTNTIYEDPPIPPGEDDPLPWRSLVPEFDLVSRSVGADWPSVAHTMVGTARLSNVQSCLQRVTDDGVAGDLIETGVWRGGVCIFMRAFLRAHAITDRQVWVADSFEGMPVPGDTAHPLDRELGLHRVNDILGIPLATVRANFARYGLLDEQVRFLPGWFADTLPTAPIDKLALIRLDGDLYGSTMDALVSLYPKLSPGGFVIVDDFVLSGCRTAVHEFREREGISDPIEPIDTSSVYWRRSG